VQPVVGVWDDGRSGREAEIEGPWHVEKIGAAPEKYQSSIMTAAPARGSAEAAYPTEGGYIGGVTKAPTGAI
jgi:hypothetical protein